MSRLPTSTRGIVTLRDVEARLRSLECGQAHCQCHKTARIGNGLTHCCVHGADVHPSLAVTVDPTGAILVHCFTGCDQMTVWRALFGDVIVAWEKARWEGLSSVDQVLEGFIDFAALSTVQLRDVIDRLQVAATDSERPGKEAERLRSALSGARKALAGRTNACISIP